MAIPSLEVPVAVIAVLVSVALSIPANFATKVVQHRWIREKEEKRESIQWYEELIGLAYQIRNTTELHKQSLISHNTLVPDSKTIERQLEIAVEQEKEAMGDVLSDELLDQIEEVLTSEEAKAKQWADYQQSAFEKIEKINQRKMSDMAALHDALLRHVSTRNIDSDRELHESLENLLIQTYIQSIFPGITESNSEEIQENCNNLIESCETKLNGLESNSITGLI